MSEQGKNNNVVVKKVVIAGGGIAGLATGLSLAKVGLSDKNFRFDVEIFEKSDLLGGKAKAKPKSVESIGFPYPIEHGYHIFPGWYKNVRLLMSETNSLDNLINLKNLYYLRLQEDSEDSRHLIEFRQGYENCRELYRNIIHNLRNGPLPWYNMLQGFYIIFDLLNHPFEQRCALDRVSLNGFMFRHKYATSILAEFGQESVLQASAIPAYEVNAMTIQKIARLWFRYSNPWLSVLKTDLQSGFIDPLANAAKTYDWCKIHTKSTVEKLLIQDGEVAGLVVKDKHGDVRNVWADYTVLATPLEVTRKWVTGKVPSVDEKLTPLRRLETMPMASLHLAFDTCIPNLPKGHVLLLHSKYSLSFIDISQIWERFKENQREANESQIEQAQSNKVQDDSPISVPKLIAWVITCIIDVISQIWKKLKENPREANESQIEQNQSTHKQGKPPNTVLSVISSNFVDLEGLREEQQIDRLVNELTRFIPKISNCNIVGKAIEPNSQNPLYINTVGSWTFRPKLEETPAENNDVRAIYKITERLYLTGDYAQNDADLTCMEGAIQSALDTAAAIAKSEEREPVIKPIRLDPYSKGLFWVYWLAKQACFPSALYAKLRAQKDVCNKPLTR